MVAESDKNFEISKELGFTVHGLGNKYRRRAQRMQPNDRVLFYVTQFRKWTLTATITSRSFVEHKPIWKSTGRGDDYQYRVRMAPDIVLEEDDYIDARILAPGLEYLKRWIPEDWPLAFYDKLHLLPQRDFALIEGEMKRIVSRQLPEEESAAWSAVEPAEESANEAPDGPREPVDHRPQDTRPFGEDREVADQRPYGREEPVDDRPRDTGPVGEGPEVADEGADGPAEPVDDQQQDVGPVGGDREAAS